VEKASLEEAFEAHLLGEFVPPEKQKGTLFYHLIMSAAVNAISMTEVQKVHVVTGGHTGIGFELCKMLLKDGNVCLVLVFRLDSPNAAGAEELKTLAASSVNCSIETVNCDLSDSASIAEAAKDVLAKHPANITCLFNNAGYITRVDEKTKSGSSKMWHINAVAPYLLAHLLRAALKGGSVVNTSSGSIYGQGKKAGALNLSRDYARPGLLGMYSMSKLAMTTMTQGSAVDFQRDDIWLCSVDPGGNVTNMTQGPGLPWILKCCIKCFASKPTAGAKLLYDALAHREHADFPSGCFVGDGGKNDTAKAPVDVRDTQKQQDCIAAIMVDCTEQMPK